MSTLGRKLRIITGLYLFLFATCHLTTLAFGLVSLGAMERAHDALMSHWQNTLGGLSLTLAVLIHLAFGFVALYRRNTLSMRAGDSIQFLSAFAIVPLLVPHAIAMMSFNDIFGTTPTFPVMLDYFWNLAPYDGFKQVLLVILVWIHGCIGLLTWMQLWARWPKLAPIVNPLVVTIPILALLGYVEAGNQVVQMTGGTTTSAFMLPGYAQQLGELVKLINAVMSGYFGLLILVLIARLIRVYITSHGSKATVTYAAGESIETKPGLTLLEIATSNGIPHAAKCRGRGRCGTCRVRVRSDVPLKAMSSLELATLQRVSPEFAKHGERLACQLQISGGSYEVESVLQADLSEREVDTAQDSVEARAEPTVDLPPSPEAQA